MFLKFGLTLVCLAIIRSVDTTSPDVLFYARVLFAVGCTLSLLTSFFIYIFIRIRNDMRIFQLKESDLKPQSPFGVAQDTKDKTIEMEVREYDTIKLKAAVKTSLTSLVISSFIHYQWGFVPPLIIQSVLNIATIMETEIFQIYILNQNEKANKALIRPFKPASSNPFEYFQKMKKEMQQQMAGDDRRKNKRTENRQKKFPSQSNANKSMKQRDKTHQPHVKAMRPPKPK